MDWDSMKELVPWIAAGLSIWVAVSTLRRRNEEDVSNFVSMQGDIKTIKGDMKDVKKSIEDLKTCTTNTTRDLALNTQETRTIGKRLDDHIQGHYYTIKERGSR